MKFSSITINMECVFRIYGKTAVEVLQCHQNKIWKSNFDFYWNKGWLLFYFNTLLIFVLLYPNVLAAPNKVYNILLFYYQVRFGYKTSQVESGEKKRKKKILHHPSVCQFETISQHFVISKIQLKAGPLRWVWLINSIPWQPHRILFFLLLFCFTWSLFEISK